MRAIFASGTPMLIALTAVWALWGQNEGGWAGTVFYPGGLALCAAGVLALAVCPFRGSLRLSKPVLVALLALVALAAWMGLSALWSPTPDAAVEGAQHILVYGLAFGLGLWLYTLLGAEMRLGLWQFALAAAFVGLLTAFELAFADTATVGRLFADDGTLEQPLGYRNANAAFWLIAAVPAIGIAADRGQDWRARALALATATLSIDLALLSQSRGSAYAAAAAVVVFVLASPRRARALAWLTLAVLPVLLMVPSVSDVFRELNRGAMGSALGDVQSAGLMTLLSTAASLALGALIAGVEHRRGSIGLPAPSNRAVAAGSAAAVVAVAIAFVVAVGDPVNWFSERTSEFRSGETPELSAESSRFTLNVASGRGDIWRVAIAAGLDEPLLGTGGGGFEYRYSAERTVDQYVRDAHSVTLSVFAELGVPGLLLLLTVFAGIGLGLKRSRALGVRAAELVVVALAVGTYWLVHASLDWFWLYPGLTAPVFALAGLACGPAILTPDSGVTAVGRRLRIGAAAALCLLAATMVPPLASERSVDQARDASATEIEEAYERLAVARDLNPLSIEPLLVEGAIARQAGDRERAIEAYRTALEQRPEAWQARYALARIYQRSNPALALDEIEAALEINPIYLRMQVFREQLQRRLSATSSWGSPPPG